MRPFSLAELVRIRSSTHFYGSTYLYVIECPGFIKVGVAGDPKRRLADLQIACPLPLRIAMAHQFPSKAAAYLSEKAAHYFLGEHCAQGEWFSLTFAEVEPLLAQIIPHADALAELRQRRALEDDLRPLTADEIERAALMKKRRRVIAINREWRARKARRAA